MTAEMRAIVASCDQASPAFLDELAGKLAAYSGLKVAVESALLAWRETARRHQSEWQQVEARLVDVRRGCPHYLATDQLSVNGLDVEGRVCDLCGAAI